VPHLSGKRCFKGQDPLQLVAAIKYKFRTSLPKKVYIKSKRDIIEVDEKEAVFGIQEISTQASEVLVFTFQEISTQASRVLV